VPTTTPPNNPVSRLNTALENARRYRAEWLLGLTHGTVTTLELLTQASTIEGRPLTRLTLRQLLGAQPRTGEATIRRRLVQLAEECGADLKSVNRLTVGWLLDSRCRGRRFLTWVAVVEVDKTQPAAWPGYPFTELPAGSKSGGKK